MKFQQFLQEKREIINGMEVFFDPSPRQVLSLTKKWGLGRWLYSIENQEFFMWGGSKSIHHNMAELVYGKMPLPIFYKNFIVGLTEIEGEYGQSVFLTDKHEDRSTVKTISQKYGQYFDRIGGYVG